MERNQDAAVIAATVADKARPALLADLLGPVALVFSRRGTPQSCGHYIGPMPRALCPLLGYLRLVVAPELVSGEPTTVVRCCWAYHS